MNPELRKGLERLLSSLPDGATGGSLNWADEKNSYWISCSLNCGQWQIGTGIYPILEPATLPSEIAIPVGTFGNTQSNRNGD